MLLLASEAGPGLRVRVTLAGIVESALQLYHVTVPTTDCPISTLTRYAVEDEVEWTDIHEKMRAIVAAVSVREYPRTLRR
jgi:hypothetical protein